VNRVLRGRDREVIDARQGIRASDLARAATAFTAKLIRSRLELLTWAGTLEFLFLPAAQADMSSRRIWETGSIMS
jgi:hypothetical protein